MEGPVLLFDGLCNLCSGVVRFVANHDAQGRFRFAPLQSPVGTMLLEGHGLEPQAFDTLVLIEDGRAYVRSTAALRLSRGLGGAWRLLYVLVALPRPLRDGLYNCVARNRYRWFGKRPACLLPTPELQHRFLA